MSFETLFLQLDESQYEIDENFKQVIKDAIEKSGFCQSIPVKQVKTVKTVKQVKSEEVVLKKTKKMSGYNLFMKETMKQLAVSGVPQTECMNEAVQLWKGLSVEEKGIWNNKVKLVNEEKVVELNQVTIKEVLPVEGVPEKKKKKLTGYNLFTKSKMGELKDIPSKDRMKEIGKLWKELSVEQKGEWKSKVLDI